MWGELCPMVGVLFTMLLTGRACGVRTTTTECRTSPQPRKSHTMSTFSGKHHREASQIPEEKGTPLFVEDWNTLSLGICLTPRMAGTPRGSLRPMAPLLERPYTYLRLVESGSTITREGKTAVDSISMINTRGYLQGPI